MVQSADGEESDSNNLTSVEIDISSRRQEINESNKTVHSFCCVCCCLSVTLGIIFIIFWWIFTGNSF